MSQFQTPESAVPKQIEWPPGSGRVAGYTGPELEYMRRFSSRLDALRHREGCAWGGAGIDFDLSCERCVLANEFTMLHELKVEFGVDIVADAAESFAQNGSKKGRGFIGAVRLTP